MADTVNHTLENAVREAEELESSGLFTRAEVKYIFQKRARFEYLLKRRRAPAARYLHYIKFETDLCKLQALRKKQPSSEGDESARDAVTHSFIRKIHSLYQRALQKFRGSVGLWLEFTTFCYTHGNKRLLSEVVSQALRLNPSCAGLWAFAASWEYKRKGDISSARYLLLRGLRNCNQSKVLWHAYFRLEMMYAADLSTRRQILGATDVANVDTVGAVAELVFDSAVKLHSDDFTFHLQFVSIAAAQMSLHAWEWARQLTENMLFKVSSRIQSTNPKLGGSLQSQLLHSIFTEQRMLSDSTLAKTAVELALKGNIVSWERLSNLIQLLRKICRFYQREANVQLITRHPFVHRDKSVIPRKFSVTRITMALSELVQMTDLLNERVPVAAQCPKAAHQTQNSLLSQHFQAANVVAMKSTSDFPSMVLNTRAGHLKILLGRGLIRSERKDKITSVGTELEHIFVHHTM